MVSSAHQLWEPSPLKLETPLGYASFPDKSLLSKIMGVPLNAQRILQKFVLSRDVLNNAMPTESVLMENVSVGQILLDKAVMNFQLKDLDQKPVFSYLKTTTTAWSEVTWQFLEIVKFANMQNVPNAQR